jgi:hypothetical protein
MGIGESFVVLSIGTVAYFRPAVVALAYKRTDWKGILRLNLAGLDTGGVGGRSHMVTDKRASRARRARAKRHNPYSIATHRPRSISGPATPIQSTFDVP